MIDQWIDLRERLPEHGQRCLISAGDVVTAAEASIEPLFVDIGANGVYWDACGFSGYEWEFDFRQDEVTHWQPSPAPAKPRAKEPQR